MQILLNSPTELYEDNSQSVNTAIERQLNATNSVLNNENKILEE